MTSSNTLADFQGVTDAAALMGSTGNTPMTLTSASMFPQSVQFYSGNGRRVCTISEDGSITFEEGLSQDETVKGFIEAVETATGRPSYPRRVHDLLETNSRYLLRARASENLLEEALERIEPMTKADEEFISRAKEYLKAPWR